MSLLQSSGSWIAVERTLAEELLIADPVDRVTWHAQAAPAPTRELRHVRVIMPVPAGIAALRNDVQPNLPWAENQFRERVSGIPLNPPPSHREWPYAEKANDQHLKDDQFSHTYPERYWPRFANFPATRPNGREVFAPHNGIRFEYGDLGDLIEVLRTNAMSRQAYLPVWFPEDLAAANQGERVPCSLGYHFLMQLDGLTLDIAYSIRSCDFVRHLRDDVYMTCRLLQWVCGQLNDTLEVDDYIRPGDLVMNIGSLHCFPPDEAYLKGLL